MNRIVPIRPIQAEIYNVTSDPTGVITVLSREHSYAVDDSRRPHVHCNGVGWPWPSCAGASGVPEGVIVVVNGFTAFVAKMEAVTGDFPAGTVHGYSIWNRSSEIWKLDLCHGLLIKETRTRREDIDGMAVPWLELVDCENCKGSEDPNGSKGRHSYIFGSYAFRIRAQTVIEGDPLATFMQTCVYLTSNKFVNPPALSFTCALCIYWLSQPRIALDSDNIREITPDSVFA